MGLNIGIVGLPNVGKSTLFNALTRTQGAQAANYPFCTIEPNKATVAVPDPRVEALAAITRPERTLHATVDFVDIAGLVKGASRGEGLGNKFLATIREADAILQVVRCFEDDNVVHVEGAVDPVRDVGIIETELLLADLEALGRRLERLQRLARSDKEVRAEVEAVQALEEHLSQGLSAAAYPGRDAPALAPTLQAVPLLTDKPCIYVANVDEPHLLTDSPTVLRLRELAQRQGAEVLCICARMEEELAGLSDAERSEFLASYGVRESSLDGVIRKSYEKLGLISYLTAGPKEVRAWPIRRGWKAPKAASVIHTDFERGFIRAQVIDYDAFIRLGGEAACKAAGLARMEGRDYEVRDGDVVLFLFNV